eukprot:UN00994
MHVTGRGDLSILIKELVHFRFCRQENPEGNIQN